MRTSAATEHLKPRRMRAGLTFVACVLLALAGSASAQQPESEIDPRKLVSSYLEHWQLQLQQLSLSGTMVVKLQRHYVETGRMATEFAAARTMMESDLTGLTASHNASHPKIMEVLSAFPELRGAVRAHATAAIACGLALRASATDTAQDYRARADG